MQDKVAVVTGASQGAGAGCARELAAKGAKVALVGRNGEKLAEHCSAIVDAGRRAEYFICDVVDAANIRSCVESIIDTFGTIDVLVNAAQGPSLRYAKLLDVKRGMIDELFGSGPFATLEFMQQCHEHLVNGGSIINFGSGAQMSPADYSMYAAAKASIQIITRAAAIEWAKEGIRANVIIPLVKSPAFEAACEADPTFESGFVSAIPLGRMGDPRTDIGPVVTFLASDESRYITGSTIMADGGHSFLR